MCPRTGKNQKTNVFILTGPTASGKSAAVLAIAPRLNAEIISADSMQVYRGMDIGTAKPTPEERARTPHHLLDIRDPWESFSVADFITEVETAIADIHSRGKNALLVGGTPMYLKGFVKGLFAGPPADWPLRRELMARAEREGVPALHAELARIDPVAARRIHVNDLRRIVRALEVYAKTRRPISHLQQQWDSPAFAKATADLPAFAKATADLPAFAAAKEGAAELPKTAQRRFAGAILVRSRQDLCARIDARVKQMFQSGLVAEVRRLLADPRGMGRGARQALGYKEVVAHLEGQRSLEETIALVQLRTRQFAKRQMTWFRSFKDFAWIEAAPDAVADEVAESVLKAFGA